MNGRLVAAPRKLLSGTAWSAGKMQGASWWGGEVSFQAAE